MNFSDDMIQEINKAYRILETKRTDIVHALSSQMLEIKSGWFNGHYHKIENGEWQMESYPIPVIAVKGLCDVEIDFDKISVSTKLGRRQGLDYSFEKLEKYSFEVYGVEDYLNDFYTEGQTLQDMKNNIEKSREKDIGFSFSFPFGTNGKVIFEFVKLIRREGFYY